MKSRLVIIFSLSLSFCFVPPSYSEFSEEMKKAVEGIAGPSDEEKEPIAKKTEVKTIISTDSDVKAYYLSWDANLEAARAFFKTKGFKERGDGSNLKYRIPVSYIYSKVTGKKLEWNKSYKKFEASNLTKRMFIASKKPNIYGVLYSWTRNQGLFLCSVIVRSKEFALKVLQKYGKPKILKDRRHNIYIYPLQGDVSVSVSNRIGAEACSIVYMNIPRLEAYYLDFKAYIGAVEAKKKNQVHEDSKGF